MIGFFDADYREPETVYLLHLSSTVTISSKVCLYVFNSKINKLLTLSSKLSSVCHSARILISN